MKLHWFEISTVSYEGNRKKGNNFGKNQKFEEKKIVFYQSH